LESTDSSWWNDYVEWGGVMKVTCTACHTRFKLKDELEGKTVRCPKCKDTFVAEPDAGAHNDATDATDDDGMEFFFDLSHEEEETEKEAPKPKAEQEAPVVPAGTNSSPTERAAKPTLKPAVSKSLPKKGREEKRIRATGRADAVKAPTKGRKTGRIEHGKEKGQKGQKAQKGGPWLAILGGAAFFLLVLVLYYGSRSGGLGEDLRVQEEKVATLKKKLGRADKAKASAEESLRALRETLWIHQPKTFYFRSNGDLVLTAKKENDETAIYCVPVGDSFEVSFSAKIKPAAGAEEVSDLSLCLLCRNDLKGTARDGYFIGFGSHENTKNKVLRLSKEVFADTDSPLNGEDRFDVRLRYAEGHTVLKYRSTSEKEWVTAIDYEDEEPLDFGEEPRYIAFYTWASKVTISDFRVEPK
jgi:predicted Zn finger-like uncharacterized protein